MRSERAGKAEHGVARIGRIAGSGSGYTEFVAGEDATNVDLVGTGRHYLVDAIGTEETPFIASTRRSEEHTSELQSRQYLVCRLLLEKKKKTKNINKRDS